MKPCLLQPKYFLKVLGILYWNSNTSLPITSVQMAAVLSTSPFFEDVTLTFLLHIMKASSSFDISVIQINIWNFQRGSKSKTFINCLTLGNVISQSERLLYILELLSAIITGAKNTLYIFVVLKALNVKNTVIHTKQKTIDSWLGIAILIQKGSYCQ